MLRDKLVGFLVTEKEFELLNEYSKALGISKSNIMRDAMLKYIKGE